MKLRELLIETTGKDTAIREVVSAVNYVQISQIYPKLKDLADTYVANNGKLKGYRLVAGGMGNRFFKQFFDDSRSGLHILLLRDLMPYLPPAVKNLVRQQLGYSAKLNSLKDIEDLVPGLLIDIGQAIKSRELTNATTAWIDAKNDYYQHLDDLARDLEDQDEPQSPTVKTPTSHASAQQRGQAEELVNSVLKDLPERVRGEIRQAIARDDNKIAALQRELTKRGIKLT